MGIWGMRGAQAAPQFPSAFTKTTSNKQRWSEYKQQTCYIQLQEKFLSFCVPAFPEDPGKKTAESMLPGPKKRVGESQERKGRKDQGARAVEALKKAREKKTPK